jgi:hypothetical protein
MFPPDPRIETGCGVGLYNVSVLDLAGAHDAEVRALSTEKLSHVIPAQRQAL